jgi:hypothetical protein
MIGMYAIIAGILLILFSLRLRKHVPESHPSGLHPTA